MLVILLFITLFLFFLTSRSALVSWPLEADSLGVLACFSLGTGNEKHQQEIRGTGDSYFDVPSLAVAMSHHTVGHTPPAGSPPLLSSKSQRALTTTPTMFSPQISSLLGVVMPSYKQVPFLVPGCFAILSLFS